MHGLWAAGDRAASERSAKSAGKRVRVRRDFSSDRGGRCRRSGLRRRRQQSDRRDERRSTRIRCANGSVALDLGSCPQDSTNGAWGTWIGPNAHRTGAANAWTIFAADPVRNVVFVPTGSPSVDYFGGERKGRNGYANSIVAIDVATGAMLWQFQTVRHDLWDYDNASPPALVTLQLDGRPIPALLLATKTGQLFALNRETGESLFPISRSQVPASDVPGEEASPSQITGSGLPPLSPQRLTLDQVWGPTAQDRDACRKEFANLRNEGAFTRRVSEAR